MAVPDRSCLGFVLVCTSCGHVGAILRCARRRTDLSFCISVEPSVRRPRGPGCVETGDIRSSGDRELPPATDTRPGHNRPVACTACDWCDRQCRCWKTRLILLFRDPVVPNLRFGTTGPDPGTYITVSNTSPYLRRYDWIPRDVGCRAAAAELRRV